MNKALSVFDSLKEQASYFPIEPSSFEAVSNLRPLGYDFGNGIQDKRFFQIDENFLRYQKNKINCRLENLAKYLLFHEFEPAVQKAAAEFLIRTFCSEYPDLFTVDTRNGQIKLSCHLSQDVLLFDQNFTLIGATPFERQAPPYINAFDALVSQVPEDVAIMRARNGSSFLSAIHLCSSGHWSPAEKMGLDFASIHAPVPGIEKINRAASSMAEAMIHKGPYTRFVWSLATDNRLNHHPEPPPGVEKKDWVARKLQPSDYADINSKFYLRVERQTSVGFPKNSFSLFMIRVYYFDGAEIKKNSAKTQLLAQAFETLTPEQRSYKGVEGPLEPLQKWLKES